jgi:hypothetical protein
MVGFNVGLAEEENGVLGTTEAGALALTADAKTQSFGVAARAKLGDDWVASVSWSRGLSAASPVAGGLFTEIGALESEAYGLALSKFAVFGESDSIGFAVSRPIHIVSGSAVMTLSTGVTDTRAIVYSTETLDLATATPETDFELGYATALMGGITLQTNLLYQHDVGGDAGEHAVAGFATLSARW